MGKRKDKDRDIEGSSDRKKSKKHRKHKKKRGHSFHSDNEEIDVVNDDICRDEEPKALKLKIKFGGKTLSTTELVSDSGNEDVNIDLTDSQEISQAEQDVFENNSESEAPIDKTEDENKWLDALEKGELDDTGEVKKEKDTSMMTARQRALHGEQTERVAELMQLPMYTERTEEEIEEIERKRKLRAKKRRQQMHKQIEDTKTQTIEKLLTKGQKAKKEISKTQTKKIIGAHIRYKDNRDGITVSFTEINHAPYQNNAEGRLPEKVKKIMCCVTGCSNLKSYACSKTKLPVCSLQCYKMVNSQNVLVNT